MLLHEKSVGPVVNPDRNGASDATNHFINREPNKRFDATKSKKTGMLPFRVDILKATLALEGKKNGCVDPEDVRREMFGNPAYHGWEVDAVQIHISVNMLLGWGYLCGTQTCFHLTERGLNKAVSTEA